MNLKLLLVLIVLCLPACGKHSLRDDKLASDLVALKASVQRDLQPTTLPNGKTYCAELSETEDAQDECLGDVEDALFRANRDKARASWRLSQGLERLRLARAPCPWYDLSCKRQARSLDTSDPGRD